MARVLLTGFEPFGSSSLNPSQELVASIGAVPGLEIHSEVLPVVFAEAVPRILSQVELLAPDVVVALGQAEGRSAINLERYAVNLMDARIPDNAGQQIRDQVIAADGPTAYESTLPLREMEAAIVGAGLPAAVSLSAGAFLCNHVFYALQHRLKDTGVRSGFIHLPLLPEQSGSFAGLPTMPLADQVRALRAALAVLARPS